MRRRTWSSSRTAIAWPAGVVMSSASPLKLRIISLTPFTPSVLKWLRSVPR
ncbi:hypothetical protein GO279_04703 [Ralstonia solanacearum]|nr:hypothetical protein [Ralstonia solanacearum]NKF57530.1 hypothetical protein [Ralstonia solanacearum]NKF62469.1 hypothetical protein [Ralstonia solanacearum]NKF72453.1 hypothetical protein [Ralstonia solanacearum]